MNTLSTPANIRNLVLRTLHPRHIIDWAATQPLQSDIGFRKMAGSCPLMQYLHEALPRARDICVYGRWVALFWEVDAFASPIPFQITYPEESRLRMLVEAVDGGRVPPPDEAVQWDPTLPASVTREEFLSYLADIFPEEFCGVDA